MIIRLCLKIVWPALALAFAGCAALQQTSSQITVRQPGHHMLSPPQPLMPDAREHLEFAWLSDAAYGNTPAGLQERKAGGDEAAQNAVVQNAETDCPVSQTALMQNHWTVWRDFPGPELRAQIDQFHLRAEVWVRQDPPAVAVAFGGTIVNNQNDWSANFRWFLPKAFLAGHPDEYSAVVQHFGPAFVAEYRTRLASGDAQWQFLRHAAIYSTGHSLGGGLAQQFAYAMPLDDIVKPVTKVYAFDPSPVTGYYSVDQDVREANSKDLLIDRIYERGEVLALVRSLTSFFVTPKARSPTIRGVRYSLFFPATPIGGHSIHHLACGLDKAVNGLSKQG
ncbi:MAG: putative lipoprotein transrane [Rhizobacter sp.]|nr:putative lipoprotein transrane [Rhizobacter sp.]